MTGGVSLSPLCIAIAWFAELVITRDDVLAARERINGYVRHTPLLPPKPSVEQVWLKCEFLQHTGVFNFFPFACQPPTAGASRTARLSTSK